jgi:hypothetical protein
MREFRIKNLELRIKFLIPLFLILIAFFLLYPNPYTLTPSFAQAGCSVQSSNPRVVNGLISAPALSSDKFGNLSGNCAVDLTKVTIAPYEVPTYEKLKLQYYTKTKASRQEVASNSISSVTDGTVYLYINPAVAVGPFSYSSTAVIFIDNSLTIYGNVTSTTGTGLVFVVKGDINIAPTVTQIDAVLISEGKIYTAGASCNTNTVSAGSLTVNGSIVSLNSVDSTPLKFCRTLIDNSTPSEKVIHQPKYLVILRNIFATNEQFWSEITAETSTQSAPPSAAPGSSPPPAAPQAPPAPSVTWNVCWMTGYSRNYTGSEVTLSWTPDPLKPVTTATIRETYCDGENPCTNAIHSKTLSSEEKTFGQISAPAGFTPAFAVNAASSLYSYETWLSGDGGDSPAIPLAGQPQCSKPGSPAVCKNVPDTYYGTSYTDSELTFKWTNTPPWGNAREIIIYGTGAEQEIVYGRIQVYNVSQIAGPNPLSLINGKHYSPKVCSAINLSTPAQINNYCAIGPDFCLNAPFMASPQCTIPMPANCN